MLTLKFDPLHLLINFGLSLKEKCLSDFRFIGFAESLLDRIKIQLFSQDQVKEARFQK